MDETTGTFSPLPGFAGVWRRLFAFCLDALLLGAVGVSLGLVAYDRLAALGDWGRAVGFGIALIYFGLLDSGLTGGQTPGKCVLGIRVVTAGGAPLGVAASTLRAAIFCVPYFLNGIYVESSGIAAGLVFLVVFGVGVSIAYLLLFNRRTRQSLHDLAVGAYVVTKETGHSFAEPNRMSPVHFGVVGLILAAALLFPLLTQRLAGSVPFAELLQVQQALQKDPDVRRASAVVGVTKFFGKDSDVRTTHVFSSDVLLSRPVDDVEAVANRLAQIVLDHDPSVEKENVVAINIRYGYDIGIASAWQRRVFALSPERWREQLSRDPAAL